MPDRHNYHVGYGAREYHHNYRRELDSRFSDENIGKKVQESFGEVCALLKEQEEIEFCRIEVTANQGIVILRGEVGSCKVKRLAENIARSVEGVKRVSNQLQTEKCQRHQSQQPSRQHLAPVPQKEGER
ncbi:MAG TPA: BON domain-containing protein [Blastocatellia bacterium]